MKSAVSSLLVRDEIYRKTGRALEIYNLGLNHALIRINYTLLRDVLTGRKRPTILLLGVEAWGFNFNQQVSNIYFKYYASQRDIVLSLDRSLGMKGVDARARGFIRDTSNLLWLVKRNPWQRRYQEQTEALINNRGGSYGGADLPLPDLPPSDRALLKREVRKMFRKELLADYDIEGASDRTFRRFISLCRERDIKLVVLNLPIHPHTLKVYEGNAYRRFTAYVAGACEDEGVRFFDMQEFSDVLDDSHFCDYVHMSTKGSHVFSRHIANTIVLPEIEAP
jgi:hypothetical protein